MRALREPSPFPVMSPDPLEPAPTAATAAPDVRTELEDRRVRRIRVAARVIGATIALTQAWAWRHQMNQDGMSYVDIASAVSHGELVVNAYWSPLYSWILGAVFAIARPSPYWEFSLVKGVNVMLFVLAFASFEFFLRELLRRERELGAARQDAGLAVGRAPVPEWLWSALGYTLFLWCALRLTSITLVTPDMCVVAAVFTAAALVLRIQRGGGAGTHIVLGVVLGVGYLAKAAMFPLAFVFFASAWLAGRRPARVGLVMVAFALVAAPWVAALSSQKGRVTFGDAGKITYAWFVVGAVPTWHWQGGPPGSGTPLHPTRKLLDTPPVFEYASPVGGTYPVWYDASYWYDGLRTRFAPARQLAVLGGYTVDIVKLLLQIMPGILILLALSQPWRAGRRALALQLPLLLPAVAGIGMYVLVLINLRYIAPFLVILPMGLLAAVRLPASSGAPWPALPRLIVLASLFTALVVGMELAYYGALDAGRLAREALGASQRHTQLDIASGLAEAGVRPGAKVATIDAAYDAYWAHLGRLRVIAEVPHDGVEAFWAAGDDGRRAVYDAFRAAGATAVVAHDPPRWARASEWVPVGSTGFLYHGLQPAAGRP